MTSPFLRPTTIRIAKACLSLSSAVEQSDYVRPAVKIESGAKSALDPYAPRTITLYLAEDLAPSDDLSVPNVTTVDP